MPPGTVGHRFIAVLAADWRGLIDRKWNSNRPLVFAHVFLTSILSACKSREIRARIDRRLDLWERGINAGLLGDALVEGRAKEGRVAKINEEEEDCLAHSFQSNFL